MSQEKNVGRRQWLRLTGGVVGGLIVGGAVGYLAKPPVEVPGPTTTVTATGAPVTVTATATPTPTPTPTEAVDFYVNPQLAGTELNIMAYDTIDTVQAKKFIDEFQTITGIKPIWTVMGEGTANDKLSLEFAAKSGTFALDYNSMDGSFVYNNAIAGNCLPLNDWFAKCPKEYNFDDVLKPTVAASSTDDGTIYGSLWDCGNHWLAYRKDLFDAENVKVPTNLDELVAAAEHFYRPDKGLYGITLFGTPDLFPFFQWDMFIWGCGGKHLDETTMEPLANSPEVIEGTDYYAKLGKYAVDWSNSEINKPTTYFSAGKAAMELNFVTALAPVLDPTTSVVYDKTGFAPWPGKVAQPNILTATGYSVNAYSNPKEQEAAFSLLTFLTSPHVQSQALKPNYGWPPMRASVVEAPENQPDVNTKWGWMAPTIKAIISAQKPGTKGATSVAASPLPRIPKPGVSFAYMKIIYTNFAKIVAGQWTAEQAMDQSQKDLVDLFKTNGLLK